MRPTLVDTDILSMFFRGHETVAANFHAHVQKFGIIHLSIITFYAILSGLKHRDANKQLDLFLRFASQNHVINLSEKSVTISSELYAEQRKKGESIDDIDLLIAGIALANDFVLATNNVSHFKKIKSLTITNWSQKRF